MTESNGKVFTYTSGDRPQSGVEHEATLAKLRAQQIEQVRATAFPPAVPPPVTPATPTTPNRHGGGRPPAASTRALIEAFASVDSHMPDGGTLQEWAERIEGLGPTFTVPGRQGRQIEYLEALATPQWREKIRLRFRKILRKKLLRGDGFVPNVPN